MDNTNQAPAFEWDDIYTGDATDYLPPDEELLSIIDSLEPGRALDVGCGAGGLVAALCERGWTVTGIDIAPHAIEAAGKVLARRGLGAELVTADAATWQPTGQFDLVTNCFALPTSQADQARAFRAMRAAVAPGGHVVIKDFDASMKRLEQFAGFHCPTVEELLSAFDEMHIVRAEVAATPAHHNDPSDTTEWTAALLHARNTPST